jgi:hypothetical protein
MCDTPLQDRLAFGRQVTAANVQSLLHIACNKVDATAAAQLLSFLLQPRSSKAHMQLLKQLTPELLQRLLCTAVERQHANVAEQLLRLPGVRQLPPRAAVAVIQAALAAKGSIAMLTGVCCRKS